MTVETESAVEAEAPNANVLERDRLADRSASLFPQGDESVPRSILEPFWQELAAGTTAWEQGQVAEAAWRNLFTGRSLLLDSERDDGTLFLLLRRSIGSKLLAAPFPTHHVDLLERSARGEPSVSLASALNVSQSAVSEVLKRLMKRLGLRSRSELLWFCREHTGLGPPTTLGAARERTIDGEIVVLAASMRPREIAIPLTPAARAVLLAVLEGESNPAIARSRRTSPATVANQVMQLLRKLGVSSRYELILRSREWAPCAPTPDRLPVALARRFAARARDP